MRTNFHIRLVVLLVASLSSAAFAETPLAPAEALARLRTDIEFLASDDLKGRSVGEDTLDEAAAYVAKRMEEIGLNTDLFDGTPMQPFDVQMGVRVGKKEDNQVKFSWKEETIVAELDEDMNPLTLGAREGKAEGPVVFAGYGVTAPDLGYDDYEGIDVNGATVIVIRKEPQMNDSNSRFDGKQNTTHATFATKIRNALKHGASAMILVNDPTSIQADVQRVKDEIALEQKRKEAMAKQLESLPEEAVNNRKTLEERISGVESMIKSKQADVDRANRGVLGIDLGAGGRRGPQIPIVSVARDVVDDLLQKSIGKSLESLENDIDSEFKPQSEILADVSVDLRVGLTPSSVSTNNVVGTLPGKGELQNETVVVGAHYDHVGMGGYGSLAPGTIAVHNGADDNASGTAAMLTVAEKVVGMLSNETSHRRFVFIAFSGEERGLLGSKHYVRNPRFSIESTAAMLNMDMVGRLKDNELTVYGTGSAPEMDPILEKANEKGGFRLFKVESGYGPSDHQSFYEAGVPVLFFFTGLHNDYHRPTDDFDKIDFGGMVRITDTVSDVALQLAVLEDRPIYAETEKRVRIRRQMTAYIGVSLSDRSDHVVLSGLTPDGPAERVGLRVGDRLEMLGKRQVKSSADVLELMRTKNPGDELPVRVRREDETIDLKVRLERRPI